MGFQFRGIPTYVSRVYPVLLGVMVIATSYTTYAWKKAEYDLQKVPDTSIRLGQLEKRVTELLKEQKEDRTLLTARQKELEQTNQKLGDAQTSLLSVQKDLTTAQSQVKNQQAQITTNAAELEKLRTRPPLFSFPSTNPADSTQQAEVKEVVTAAYDVMREVLGDPYNLSGVTISFSQSLSITGSTGETRIESSSSGVKIAITLQKFSKDNFADVNTVLHEIIHAFHSAAVVDEAYIEEGKTVAETDAVMKTMIERKLLPEYGRLYLIATDEQLAKWGSITIPKDSAQFYQGADVSKRYQITGTAWYKLYQADPTIFKRLNNQYYPEVQRGIFPNQGVVFTALKAIQPNVGTQTIEQFIAAQHGLNPN